MMVSAMGVWFTVLMDVSFAVHRLLMSGISIQIWHRISGKSVMEMIVSQKRKRQLTLTARKTMERKNIAMA